MYRYAHLIPRDDTATVYILFLVPTFWGKISIRVSPYRKRVLIPVPVPVLQNSTYRMYRYGPMQVDLALPHFLLPKHGEKMQQPPHIHYILVPLDFYITHEAKCQNFHELHGTVALQVLKNQSTPLPLTRACIDIRRLTSRPVKCSVTILL